MSVNVGEGEENLVDQHPTPAHTHQALVSRGLARTGTDATIIGSMAALTALAGALAIGTANVSLTVGGRTPHTGVHALNRGGARDQHRSRP